MNQYLDAYDEIASGDISGVGMTQKFGYNAAVTTAEDVWAAGGVYTGFLAVAGYDTVNVVSASADDTAADGTGARTIRVLGLDAAGLEVSEDFTLAGATPVAGTQEFSRVNRAYVLTAGSGETNAGIITIDTDTANTVVATIGATDGQTLIACYTIPSNKAGRIVNWKVGLSKSGAVAASGTVALQTKASGGAWRTREIHAMNAGTSFDERLNIAVAPLTDIRIRVLSVSSEVLVSASFDIVEVESPS